MKKLKKKKNTRYIWRGHLGGALEEEKGLKVEEAFNNYFNFDNLKEI